ncbi:hypothetical protein [Sulfurimonas sp.]|uniref:hypothetical protein n=1 Tax=Sulfurimonas sp. TaxID=2022749 RepID=UPI0025D65CC1|nr:hypothetical protein [Sulfurimonas sp.]MBW6487464.1 hypothetical protein [Sulfurimonas sp.]
MMNEDDILQDACMKEIQDICENSSDWQEAIEFLAVEHNYLGDKKIIQIVMNYFFPKEKHLIEDLKNAN